MNYFEELRDFLIKIRKKLKRLFFYNVPFDEEELEEELEDKGGDYMPRYPHNEREFPFNIYEPDKIMVGDRTYKRYRAKFSSLHDLYMYLSSNPRTNREVFSKLHSVENDSDFAGIPYEDALEELEEAPRSGYREFLHLSERLNDDAMGYVQEHEIIKSPGGGYIDIPSYASGDPLCYRISRSTYTPKFIRVHIALSYYWGTTKEQVLNRALIIAALVNAFEQAGYIVEVNTFEMSKEDDEIIDIDVNIKNNNETFNKASLYKTLCYVEFLRRLLFRVLETLDVKNYWGSGYGETCSEHFVRQAKRMGENDIFFDQPREMGIRGKDIGADFVAAIEHLDLGDKIDVESAKREFDKDIKKLQKTIK